LVEVAMTDDMVAVEVGPLALPHLQKEWVEELARREGITVTELLGRILAKRQPEVAFAYHSGGMEAVERAATEAWNSVMEEVFALVRAQ
jgi:hypothetical protein